ncbi:hypothetical protein [Streptomyces flaveolus]|uniref:hypothetical protein n=1 Tax=Streptomyces flaveolus TaxID=67297 RepID=UPI0033298988
MGLELHWTGNGMHAPRHLQASVLPDAGESIKESSASACAVSAVNTRSHVPSMAHIRSRL